MVSVSAAMRSHVRTATSASNSESSDSVAARAERAPIIHSRSLVETAVSVLRDRQEKIRCCMLREASLLDTLAQQLVKLFRYDKARLKRVTNVLERYVEDCAEIKFWTPP